MSAPTSTPLGLGVPIDLETTGLDPVKDTILEFAMLLVDDNLDVIAEFGSRVIHAEPAQLERMNEYVTNMHTRSGLLEEVKNSTVSLATVDFDASQWLIQHGVGVEAHPSIDTRGIIIGSSVRLDLNFIEAQMPLVAAVLHYRLIDISGIREALARWAPVLIPTVAPSSCVAHRAMEDIRESLYEAREQRLVLRCLEDSSPMGQAPELDWHEDASISDGVRS